MKRPAHRRGLSMLCDGSEHAACSGRCGRLWARGGRLGARGPLNGLQVMLWVDYCCLEQDKGLEVMRGVDSLPSYIEVRGKKQKEWYV